MNISCSLVAQSDPEHYGGAHGKPTVTIVRCLDARFKNAWTKFEEHLAAHGFRHVDVAQFAGGAKVVASPKDGHLTQSACYQVVASLVLHHPVAIVLSTHEACGDYGMSFATSEEERTFHEAELRRARDEVKKFIASDNCVAMAATHFPGKALPRDRHEIPVKLVYNNFEGFVEIA